MILLDGKKLSQKILDDVRQEVLNMKKKLRLAVVVVGQDRVVSGFIDQKKKAANSIGIDIRMYSFENSVTTNELRKRLAEITHEEKNTGIIIQLPLPPHLNVQYILNSVTPDKDIDMLSARAMGSFVAGKSIIISPVVQAVKKIFQEYEINYNAKHNVIMGAGNLVGRPIALWLLSERCNFSVITKGSPNQEEILRSADIIITGIGKPRFLKANMVKDGVVVVDAGTSESEGKLMGDVDFDSVSKVASFITPVPGGVGPLTVAMLFHNLVTLAKQERLQREK